MKRKLFISFFSATLLFLASCSFSKNTSEVMTAIPQFTVTFKNYDGSKLYETMVLKGENAVYDGIAPYKESNCDVEYIWTGWDKPLTNITSSFTTFATYREKQNTFLVNYHDYEGNVIYKEYVHYGEASTYLGTKPVKPSDSNNAYEFYSWDYDLRFISSNVDTYPLFYNINAQINVIDNSNYMNYKNDISINDGVLNFNNSSLTYESVLPLSEITLFTDNEINIDYYYDDHLLSTVTLDENNKTFIFKSTLRPKRFIINGSANISSIKVVAVDNKEDYIDPYEYTSNLTFELENDAYIAKYSYNYEENQNENKIIVPSFYNNLPVVSFVTDESNNINFLHISEGVKSINATSYSFPFENLYSMSLPSSLEKITNFNFVDDLNDKYDRLLKTTTNHGLIFFGNEDNPFVFLAGHTDSNNYGGLVSLQIPESTKIIGYKGLEEINSNSNYNDNVPVVTIPKNITQVCEDAFKNCSAAILRFDENSNLKYINSRAFYNAKFEDDLYLPSNILEIELEAFKNANTKRVHVPNYFTHQDAINAFCNIKAEEFVVENSSNFAVENGVLFNKSKTSLLCYPMKKNNKVYIVPEGVLNISSIAFNFEDYNHIYSSVLNVVFFPETLQQYYTYSPNIALIFKNSYFEPLDADMINYFYPYYENIEKSIIINKIMYIVEGDKATVAYYLEDESNLNIEIKNEVTIDNVTYQVNKIGAYAFSSSHANSINIPEGIEVISEFAFEGASFINTNDLYLPNSLKIIGSNAFRFFNSTKNYNVYLPSGLTSIKNAFDTYKDYSINFYYEGNANMFATLLLNGSSLEKNNGMIFVKENNEYVPISEINELTISNSFNFGIQLYFENVTTIHFDDVLLLISSLTIRENYLYWGYHENQNILTFDLNISSSEWNELIKDNSLYKENNKIYSSDIEGNAILLATFNIKFNDLLTTYEFYDVFANEGGE